MNESNRNKFIAKVIMIAAAGGIGWACLCGAASASKEGGASWFFVLPFGAFGLGLFWACWRVMGM